MWWAQLSIERQFIKTAKYFWMCNRPNSAVHSDLHRQSVTGEENLSGGEEEKTDNEQSLQRISSGCSNPPIGDEHINFFCRPVISNWSTPASSLPFWIATVVSALVGLFFAPRHFWSAFGEDKGGVSLVLCWYKSVNKELYFNLERINLVYGRTVSAWVATRLGGQSTDNWKTITSSLRPSILFKWSIFPSIDQFCSILVTTAHEERDCRPRF